MEALQHQIYLDSKDVIDYAYWEYILQFKDVTHTITDGSRLYVYMDATSKFTDLRLSKLLAFAKLCNWTVLTVLTVFTKEDVNETIEVD